MRYAQQKRVQYECSRHPNGHGYDMRSWPSCMWCNLPLFSDPDYWLYVRRFIISEQELS